MPAKRSSPCRLRKAACPDCGYTIRVTRSWMSQGLPGCPCGAQLEATEMSDRAYLGLITQQDVRPTDWTDICRENGWDDMIVRRGNAAKAYDRKVLEGGGIMGRRTARADHCVYAGCGRWVAAEAEVCSAGHAQHAGAELEAMPF